MDVDNKTPIPSGNQPNANGTDCGLGTLEESIYCAKVWNRMTYQEQERYRRMNGGCAYSDEASTVDICDDFELELPVIEPRSSEIQLPSCSTGRKSKCLSRRPKTRCCLPRKRKRPCAVKRKKWVKPGPITNNPYLNFVRTVRRKYCGLMPRQLVILAAYEWRCMSDDKKLRYRRQASQVSANERLHRRCGCATMCRSNYQ